MPAILKGVPNDLPDDKESNALESAVVSIKASFKSHRPQQPTELNVIEDEEVEESEGS